MKIKIKNLCLEEVLKIKKPQFKRPKRPNLAFRTLIRLLSIPDLLATHFEYTKIDMNKAGEGPYFILMNHSSFIDLEIASNILPSPLLYRQHC